MAHDAHIREKALVLRRNRGLTIDEIAERLALSRTTIYYWVKDIPIERDAARRSAAQQVAAESNAEKHRRRRRASYQRGYREFHRLALDPAFRDFVSMYIGEGTKRNRNCVALCNSDPAVVSLAARWIRAYSANPVRFSLQYHADQDPERLRLFWAMRIGVDPGSIRLQRKSNSGGLRGRTWRSRHGVLTVDASDTQLRARLQGWIDAMKDDWVPNTLHGVGA